MSIQNVWYWVCMSMNEYESTKCVTLSMFEYVKYGYTNCMILSLYVYENAWVWVYKVCDFEYVSVCTVWVYMYGIEFIMCMSMYEYTKCVTLSMKSMSFAKCMSPENVSKSSFT